MEKISRKSTIDAGVEKVFSYISNPVNQLEWLPGITSVRNVSGEGKAQTFGWTYKMVGLSLTGKTETVEYVPNKKIVIKTSGGVTSTWTWQFSKVGNKTDLDLNLEYTVPVPVLGKLAEKLVIRQNSREASLAMANIKNRMEI
jgi:carbon monoxide dehydrogenase subunit G